VQLTVNGEPCDVPEASTIAQLLERLALRNQHVAVEVNREVVARARHAEHRLKAGDTVEIVTLVGGG
jgi:thiamine biosynthesis protein ThiS